LCFMCFHVFLHVPQRLTTTKTPPFFAPEPRCVVSVGGVSSVLLFFLSSCLRRCRWRPFFSLRVLSHYYYFSAPPLNLCAGGVFFLFLPSTVP
jgi:hypothetical protein